MSSIYFHAAMALVNARHTSEPGDYRTRGGLGYSHRMRWTRRTQIMSFCEKKLSMRLGQR